MIFENQFIGTVWKKHLPDNEILIESDKIKQWNELNIIKKMIKAIKGIFNQKIKK